MGNKRPLLKYILKNHQHETLCGTDLAQVVVIFNLSEFIHMPMPCVFIHHLIDAFFRMRLATGQIWSYDREMSTV